MVWKKRCNIDENQYLFIENERLLAWPVWIFIIDGGHFENGRHFELRTNL